MITKLKVVIKNKNNKTVFTFDNKNYFIEFFDKFIFEKDKTIEIKTL